MVVECGQRLLEHAEFAVIEGLACAGGHSCGSSGAGSGAPAMVLDGGGEFSQ